MHRVYCPDQNLSASELTITDPNEIHHARAVMRLKPGAQVGIFDGKGKEAEGKISGISAKRIIVAIASREDHPVAKPDIILACAIPKKSKFEWIIEKASELLIKEIVPLKTERTEFQMTRERGAKKLGRYETVAVNAARQCRRATVPRVRPVTDFASALKIFQKNSLCIIPSLEGTPEDIFKIFAAHPVPEQICFFIGPEGDFTRDEYALAKKSGCLPASLGPTILKVETAALSVCAGAHLYYHKISA